jgi:hypothetical protein
MALITGVTMGLLAAVAAGFYNIELPSKGICAVSHPEMLTNWIINHIFGTKFYVESIFVVVPVVTPIGWVLGSFIAAKRNKEFKLRPGPVRDSVLAFILGFLIINFGLLWGSCPLGTAVLAAYGGFMAILMLGMIVLGVVSGCIYIKWRVRRPS